MTNTTMISPGVQLPVWAVWGAEAYTALFDLRWMLALMLALILADFWLGIADSLKRHGSASFRFSRAGRRTCGKVAEYLTYLLIGSLLGLAIFEPLGWASHVATAAVGAGFGCLWEIDSIIGHVCSLHGVEARFSVKRFLLQLMKRRMGDVGEAIEQGLEGDSARDMNEDSNKSKKR